MLRKLLGAGAVLAVVLAGCRGPKGACDTNEDCGQGQTCDATVNLCFVTVTRFTAFEFLAPGGTSAVVKSGPVKLRARLVPPQGDAAPNFPQTVAFKVSEAGTVLAEGVLAHQGEGLYEGEWTAPEGEKTYELTLSYTEAGLSETKAFRTDNTAPRFTVSVPQPEVVAATGTTTYADPQLPLAWRRDAVVSVSVTADESVEPGSVKLRVHGIGEGAAVEEVPVTPAASCEGAFCGVAQVDLSKPGMKAFRGNFNLEVVGADAAGNGGSVANAGVVPVTRWKWVFEQAAAIQTSPAIGADGTVYFGTAASSTAGEVFALRPDGTSKWAAPVALGAVKASPAVGTVVNGVERVYVAANSGSGGTLHALGSADGSAGQESCLTSGASYEGSLAVVTTTVGGASSETAVGVANLSTPNGGTLTALRPGDTARRCTLDLSEVENVLFPGAVSAKGNSVYFGDHLGNARAYVFESASWQQKAGWPVATGLFTRALAISGSKIVGGGGGGPGAGGLLTLGFDGQGLAKADWETEAWNPSLGPGDVALAGLNNGKLLRAPVDNLVSSVEVPGAAVVKGAPLFGQGGRVYTATMGGTLEVRDADFAPLWSEERFGATGGVKLGAVEASLASDCARPGAGGTSLPGRPGVLYVPSTAGKLFAFVVDSRGLDTSAPWPKYQHDPRNTGNADTRLADFACP